MQLVKNNIYFLILLCIGCSMRFYHFADWSLTNDELSALSRLQFDTLSSVIENGVRLDDMHPMGVQVFLWFWTKCFGFSVFVVRLPFVILGCLSLLIVYQLAKDWLGANRALIVLSIISCSEFPILYSQLARPYSPGLFFSLLFVWSWNKILFVNENKNRFSKWNFVLILAGVGAMYSHYFSFLFVGLTGLVGLFFINEKKQRLYYLLTGIAMFILYLPNVNVMITHFSVGGLGGEGGWLGPPSKYAIAEFILYAFNNDWLLVGVVLVSIVISIFQNKFKIENRKVLLISLILGFLPVVIAYCYSLIKNPVFQYSILLFSFPLIIIGFVSMLNFSNLKHNSVLLTVITILFFYSSVISKKYYQTEQFAVFKDIAVDIEDYTSKYRLKNIDYTVNVIKPYYINYYLSHSQIKIPFLQYSCNNDQAYLALDSILKKSNKKYFLHAWSNNYHAPELEFRIRKLFPYLIESDIHFNSGIYLFSKDSSHQLIPKNILFEEKNDFEKNYWNSDDGLFANSSDALSGKMVSVIDSAHEYGITYTNSLDQIHLSKNKSLVVELNLKTNKIPDYDKLLLVVEIDSPQGEIKVWRSLQFQPFLKNKNDWTALYYGYKYVEDLNPDDVIKIYVYNPGKYSAEIDDMIIRVVD